MARSSRIIDSTRQFTDALRRGHRFVTHDVWYIGRPGEEVPHGLIIKQIRVFILLVRNLLQGQFLMRSAALTFTSLLAIAPSVVILYFVIQKLNLGVYAVQFVLEIAPRERANAELTRPAAIVQSMPALPDADAASPSAGAGLSADEETNERVIRTFLRWLFADVGSQSTKLENVTDPIDVLMTFVHNVLEMQEQGNGGGAFAIASLSSFVLLTVFGMMWNIESAFNAIWGVRRTRSWVRIFSDYILITLLLPFVVAGVLGLTIALQNPSVQLGPFASGLRGVQYFSVWTAFSVLYAVVPNTKVRWRYALLGGVIAGSLWLFGSWIYLHLQIGVTRNSIIYASFALLPLLMTWIYVSWIILLFGAELTFAYQNERTFAMERHAAGASYAYREAVAIRAMIEIGYRFDQGMGGLSTEDAGGEWNVPTRVINETVDQLLAAGLVRRCATEPISYAPARSLDKISIADVVKALREAGREPSALRDDEVLRPILDQVGGSGSQFMFATLDTMVRRFHPRHEAIEVVAAPALLGSEEPAPAVPHENQR